MILTSFAQNAVKILCESDVNVEIQVRGFAKTKKNVIFSKQ